MYIYIPNIPVLLLNVRFVVIDIVVSVVIVLGCGDKMTALCTIDCVVNLLIH